MLGNRWIMSKIGALHPSPPRTAAATRLLALEKIDARLMMRRNTEAERALLIAKRRHVADADAWRVGGRSRSRHFILETARVAKLSPATVYRDLRRADELGNSLLERIVRTSLDRGRRLDELIKLPKAERELVVRRAKQEASQ
jgi:hypothetical protein